MTIKGDTVSVVAPATLSEGYTFDVTVEGKTISVVVPPGGVEKGQKFNAQVVKSKKGSDVETGVPQDPSATAAKVPTGEWRHDIFSCFDVICGSMCMMSFFCSPMALGQILQRLGLNVCGQSGGDYKNTCKIWTLIWVVTLIVAVVLAQYTKGPGAALYYAASILMLVALTKARYHVRTKWSIPADCCEKSGCLSDCCCAYWCGCCAIIQMMRHTHDEKEDRYNCGSTTGLDAGAAKVV